MRERDRERVERKGDRRGVEVRSREHRAVREQNDRVVGRRCELDLDLASRVRESLQDDADDLRQAAERERILDLPSRVGIVQRAPVEKAAKQGGGLHLPSGRAQRCDAGVEDRRIRSVTLGRKRRGVDREEHEAGRVGQRDRGVSHRHRARVAERVAILDPEPRRRESRSRQRLSSGKPLVVVPRFAAADRDRSYVRREAEIRSTDGAPPWDDGRHAPLDHGEQHVEERRRDSGTSLRQPDTAHDQRGAADPLGEGLAHADRPTAYELLLELLELRSWDAEADVGAEAGVETVDGLVSRGVALDHITRLGDERPRDVGQRQGRRPGRERDPRRRS